MIVLRIMHIFEFLFNKRSAMNLGLSGISGVKPRWQTIKCDEYANFVHSQQGFW